MNRRERHRAEMKWLRNCEQFPAWEIPEGGFRAELRRRRLKSSLFSAWLKMQLKRVRKR